MAFFKLISLIHCVTLVQLSSYGRANRFSICNHTKIMESYSHLLQKTMISATSESHYETEDVINCCPQTKKPLKLEALLSCIHNFTRVCVASHSPEVWRHTGRLLEANCSGYVAPKMDNIWNATVTHKDSWKCKLQRTANKKCGNHTLRELKMMWDSYMTTN